jgi:spore germination cell wall hydrolase CwlJ-like protein
MRNPSNPLFASRGFASSAQILDLARRPLFRNVSLAFAGSVAAVAITVGPEGRQHSWLHNGHFAKEAETSPRSQSFPGVDGATPARTANAELALRQATLAKAEPFHYSGTGVYRTRAAECLAAAAWYEVGDDPTGQRAVIQTVINRVTSPSFPNSFCGVVFQGSELPTGCQFTFTCDGSLKRRHPSAAAWKRALSLAQQALDGFVDRSVGTATHYHASYVTPWWSGHLERLATVGPHIFYRWAHGRHGADGDRQHLVAEQDYEALVEKSTRVARDLDMPQDSAAAQAFANATSAMPAVEPGRAKMSPGSTIFMSAPDGEASGRWALAAMKTCQGRSDCQVLGYGSKEQILQNQNRAANERERPVFLFVRDSASSMAIALWDCHKVSRPVKSECLPDDKKALASLMRERPRID